jgi:hypothetical protein
MTEKPKPLPYYFYKTEDWVKLVRERDEARHWARKMRDATHRHALTINRLYQEKTELLRLVAKVNKPCGDFLVPCDDESVEYAAYELLNGQTETYRQMWLNELVSRVLARNDRSEAELRRQLAIANRALEWYAGGGVKYGATLHNCDIATNALIEMRGGYKSARGILPWKEGDEPDEDAIRRLRGEK